MSDFDEILVEQMNKKKEKLDSLLLSIKSLEGENDYNSIIALIDDNIDLFDEKIELYSQKIRFLYKSGNYNELIKCTIEKEKIDKNSKDKAYTLFYKSMAFESLGEINHAIEELELIEDNISKADIVNKYIKLSMLYLRVSNFDKAKEDYDYALKIDHFRENNMFDLLESDLFYHSSKYEEALQSFEKFFLRSANKYKYLDRYILINTKLNRLTDAYNFYSIYKDKVSKYTGSQYSLPFFNASKNLLVKLDKLDEINEINKIIDSLTQSYFGKVEEEKIGYIKRLVEAISFPLTKLDKRRNIVNRIKRIIEPVIEDIYYIEDTPDGLSYTRFDKTQSRETIIPYSVLKEKGIIDEFVFEENTVINHFYNDKLIIKENEYLVLKIKNDLYDFGYIVVNNNKEYKDVFEAFASCLLEVFIRLDSISKNNTSFDALLSSLTEKEIGFIKVTSDTVELYNKYAKEIFNTNKKIIDFIEFKKLFIKNIYVDSFMHMNGEHMNIMIDGMKRTISFDSIIINNVIYAFVRDITDSIDIDKEREKYYYNSNTKFYNENKLREVIEKENDSFSIVGLNIKIVEDQDSLNYRNDKLNLLYDLMKKIEEDSFVFYIGENHFLYLLKTVDKRNLESLYNKLIKNIFQLYKYSHTLKDSLITGFASKSLKNKDYNDVFNIIEYGFSYSSRRGEFIVLDNDEKKAYQIYKSFESDIVKRIKNKELSISYLPIVKESNREIHYLYPVFASIYDFNYDAIENIINDNNIQVEADTLILENLINNKKEFKAKFKYIVNIHSDSLYSPAFIKRVVELIKKNGLDDVIILKVDNAPEKGIIGLLDSSIRISQTVKSFDQKFIDELNVLFIKVEEENSFNKCLVETISTLKNKEIVVDTNEKIFIDSLTLKPRKLFTVEDLKKF